MAVDKSMEESGKSKEKAFVKGKCQFARRMVIRDGSNEEVERESRLIQVCDYYFS